MTAVIDRAGEVVSWVSPKEATYGDIQAALIGVGMPETFAREMLPANAFTRAARKLADKRIIRKLSDSTEAVRYQFTREFLDSTGEYEYQKEAVLTLDKSSGSVWSEDNDLADKLTRLISAEIEKRTSADVSKIVARMFERRGADLVPLRPAGGVYFVPQENIDIANAADGFLRKIGGVLNRFALVGGDSRTNESLADAMSNHLKTLANDLKDLCAQLGVQTGDAVIARRFGQIKGLRDKLSTYRHLLAGLAAEVEAEIDGVDRTLQERLESVAEEETQAVCRMRAETESAV